MMMMISDGDLQIHGGGIFTGSASTSYFGPDYFMQKDVLIVTFQFRMGVFGFLSLDDPSLNIPGNAQFRDHIFALKWIQRNIEKFGGDPSNITLFGESWGGGSTHFHMVSDKSKGLFHRGILMSGSALNTGYSLVPRRNWAERLCMELGYGGPTEEKYLLKYLEDSEPKDIVTASAKIITEDEKTELILVAPFGPTIEPYDHGSAFITKEIIQMAKDCWGNKIDIMIGATSNECSAISLLPKADFERSLNFDIYIPNDLKLEPEDKKRPKFSEMLRKNYYGMLQPTKTNLDGLMHVMNDKFLWHPISRVVRSRENSRKGGKSFVYRFDIDSDNNLLKKIMKIDEKYREPAHADDVYYIFKATLGHAPSIESPGFKGIKLMLSIFTEFASTGNPNVPELGDNVEWEPATFIEPLKGININEEKCEVIVLPEAERIKVFDDIFIACGEELY